MCKFNVIYTDWDFILFLWCCFGVGHDILKAAESPNQKGSQLCPPGLPPIWNLACGNCSVTASVQSNWTAGERMHISKWQHPGEAMNASPLGTAVSFSADSEDLSRVFTGTLKRALAFSMARHWPEILLRYHFTLIQPQLLTHLPAHCESPLAVKWNILSGAF